MPKVPSGGFAPVYPVVSSGGIPELTGLEDPTRGLGRDRFDPKGAERGTPAPRADKRPGAGIAEAMLFDEQKPIEAIRAALPEKLVAPLVDALSELRGPERREALAGLGTLSERRDREALALSFLTGMKSRRVKPADVERFKNPEVRPQTTASRLRRFHRKTEANRLLAFVPADIRTPLFEAILEHPSAETVSWALGALDGFSKETRGAQVTELFIGAGLIPEQGPQGSFLRALKSQDPVGILAQHRFAAERASGEAPVLGTAVERWVETLSTLGLNQTRAWVNGDDANRRGQIAEALRRVELASAISSDDGDNTAVLQGVYVVDQPPELAAAQTFDEARAWCRRNKERVDKLFAVDLDGGKYALLANEVDFIIGHGENGMLALDRIENVKAGAGSAKDARDQNALALEVLHKPHGKLLVPGEDGTFFSVPLKRASAATADTLTVGPAQAGGYDHPLPLDASQIRRARVLLEARQNNER